MRAAVMTLIGVGLFMAFTSFLPGANAQTSGGNTGGDLGFKFLAAGIAFGLAAAGAGYGIGQSAAAGVAAVAEKPEVRTTALIFVALAEAIAIYGFVIAIIILGQTV